MQSLLPNPILVHTPNEDNKREVKTILFLLRALVLSWPDHAWATLVEADPSMLGLQSWKLARPCLSYNFGNLPKKTALESSYGRTIFELHSWKLARSRSPTGHGDASTAHRRPSHMSLSGLKEFVCVSGHSLPSHTLDERFCLSGLP